MKDSKVIFEGQFLHLSILAILIAAIFGMTRMWDFFEGQYQVLTRFKAELSEKREFQCLWIFFSRSTRMGFTYIFLKNPELQTNKRYQKLYVQISSFFE